MYQSYNCAQIEQEARRVSAKVAQVEEFWPPAFFIGGDKENAAELARLKGELDALEMASINKRCNITFRAATA